MDPDEAGSGALPHRIRPDRGTGGERSLAEAPHSAEPGGKGLQSMQAELAPVFGLEEHPVLVPAGQKVTGERHPALSAPLSPLLPARAADRCAPGAPWT